MLETETMRCIMHLSFLKLLFKCSSFLRKAHTSMFQSTSGCPETATTSWNTEKVCFFFLAKWVYHATEFSEVLIFKLSSPNSMVLAEAYVRTHERLHWDNGKCLRNSIKSLFLKMRFIMQLSFLSLCFSGVLVFSVLYYCDRSLCFNARAVAQKKWQMLD